MRFVDLSQHLRQLRFVRTGRALEVAMRPFEVWRGAEECPHNGVAAITFRTAPVPRPFDGLFARYSRKGVSGQDLAVIIVKSGLPPHWEEFALIKEMMHCWSPPSTYVDGPREAAQLITALNMPTSRYPANATSDLVAIQAAAEVILPHYVVEHELLRGLDIPEIAHRHGLHPDVAQLICRHDLLMMRKEGCL